MLADNDLCKVSRTVALAGIDVEFPMLDDRVVALSCRIPPERPHERRDEDHTDRSSNPCDHLLRKPRLRPN
ncbi:hypothetical protein [Aquisalimonas sp.]|uniref:hypothetical protein n=1 Tax=Aquisalimonas sp. TaxID=1872621 RepID=UPI0025C0069D|nr:hypothetical protein [Aquisalimonas sp.]